MRSLPLVGFTPGDAEAARDHAESSHDDRESRTGTDEHRHAYQHGDDPEYNRKTPSARCARGRGPGYGPGCGADFVAGVIVHDIIVPVGVRDVPVSSSVP